MTLFQNDYGSVNGLVVSTENVMSSKITPYPPDKEFPIHREPLNVRRTYDTDMIEIDIWRKQTLKNRLTNIQL